MWPTTLELMVHGPRTDKGSRRTRVNRAAWRDLGVPRRLQAGIGWDGQEEVEGQPQARLHHPPCMTRLNHHLSF